MATENTHSDLEKNNGPEAKEIEEGHLKDVSNNQINPNDTTQFLTATRR